MLQWNSVLKTEFFVASVQAFWLFDNKTEWHFSRTTKLHCRADVRTHQYPFLSYITLFMLLLPASQDQAYCAAELT